MKRREFISSTAVGLAALDTVGAKAKDQKYKVAVIGRTGKGNYGHGLDVVWNDIDQADVVAVADEDAKGRSATAKRLRAPRAYADYREMLDKERPQIVSVAAKRFGLQLFGTKGTFHCRAPLSESVCITRSFLSPRLMAARFGGQLSFATVKPGVIEVSIFLPCHPSFFTTTNLWLYNSEKRIPANRRRA